MFMKGVWNLTHAVLRSTANSAAEREPVSRRDILLPIFNPSSSSHGAFACSDGCVKILSMLYM